MEVDQGRYWTLRELRNHDAAVPRCEVDSFSGQALAAWLPEDGLVWGGVDFNETDSTNTVALNAGKAGTPEGFLVTAGHQLAGRGRAGRKWWCPPGAGVLCSLLVRPPDLPAASAFRLTQWTAVALAESLRETTGLKVWIKWPNDLHIEGRKLGGVLIETALHHNQVSYAVAGWGINIHQVPGAWPADLAKRATSVDIETHQRHNRLQLLANMLHHLSQSYAGVCQTDQQLGERWRRLCDTPGQTVQIKLGSETIHGYAEELQRDGTLVVRAAEGQVRRINSGEVLACAWDH